MRRAGAEEVLFLPRWKPHVWLSEGFATYFLPTSSQPTWCWTQHVGADGGAGVREALILKVNFRPPITDLTRGTPKGAAVRGRTQETREFA